MRTCLNLTVTKLYLQAWQGPKVKRLHPLPERFILHSQQSNITLCANGQHFRYELLIISTSLHFHLRTVDIQSETQSLALNSLITFSFVIIDL